MRSRIKYLNIILFTIIVSCNPVTQKEKFRSSIQIPARGNSWVTNDLSYNDKMISDSGIINWIDTSTIIRTYFRLEKTGLINIAIRAKVKSGKSRIICTLGEATKVISLSNEEFDTIYLGTFKIQKTGYQALKMKGLIRSGSSFADISDILISGEATGGKVQFVKDDFYWGRRGPSVHLSYEVPENTKDIVLFYNEITVPEGNDIMGSYFMADGFTDGYFGIQVNAPDERRILFSVWSPFKTDNPKDTNKWIYVKMEFMFLFEYL